MTIGLYFQPGGVPTILSDTLITRVVLQIDNATLLQELTPRNLVLNEISETKTAFPAMARMVRKVIRLDPGVIIALAGNMRPILTYAREVQDFWQRATPAQKEFEALQHRFSFEHFNHYKVSGICAICRETPYTGQDEVFVSTSNGIGPKLEAFGTCIAIGSGAPEVLSYLEHNNRNHLDWINTGVPQDQIDRVRKAGVREAVGTLNTSQIFTGGFRGLDPTWGGYVEAFNFDFDRQTWRSNYNALNLLVVMHGTRDKPVIGHFPRSFAFCQNEGNEAILASTMADHAGKVLQKHAYLWTIQNLLDPPTSDAAPRPADFEIDTVTITVQYWDAKRKSVDFRHFTYAQHPDTFQFFVRKGQLEGQIHASLIRDMARKICADCEMSAFAPLPVPDRS